MPTFYVRPPHGVHRTNGYQVINFPTIVRDRCAGILIAVKNIGNAKQIFDPTPPSEDAWELYWSVPARTAFAYSPFISAQTPNHPWLAPQQPRSSPGPTPPSPNSQRDAPPSSRWISTTTETRNPSPTFSAPTRDAHPKPTPRL